MKFGYEDKTPKGASIDRSRKLLNTSAGWQYHERFSASMPHLFDPLGQLLGHYMRKNGVLEGPLI